MSLVAYGSSDESDGEDDSTESGSPLAVKVNINNQSNVPVKKTNPSGLSKVDVNKDTDETNMDSNTLSTLAANIIADDDGAIEQDNRFMDKREKQLSTLPPPKPTKLHDIDFDWNKITNKRTTQSVKISIPSLSELKNEESSEPVKKKLKPSKKGSGLFALLPNPKNTFIIPTRTTLKPQPMNKVSPKSVPKMGNVAKNMNNSSLLSSKLPSVDDDFEDDNEIEIKDSNVDFFSLSNPVSLPIVDIRMDSLETPPSVKDDVKTNESIKSCSIVNQNLTNLSLPVNDLNVVAPSINEEASSSSIHSESSYIPLDHTDLQLDEIALQQLCGRRERRKGGSNLQIIDVNGDAILPDSREWLTKQLTEEQNSSVQSHKKKDGPTTQQRRKHQITYLAFQAKEHELELKNQWANNRMSRKQTQAKYGF